MCRRRRKVKYLCWLTMTSLRLLGQHFVRHIMTRIVPRKIIFYDIAFCNLRVLPICKGFRDCHSLAVNKCLLIKRSNKDRTANRNIPYILHREIQEQYDRLGKWQILFNFLSRSYKGIQRYRAQCTWMYTFYLSPLCQASTLRSIQSSDIHLSAMVCHFSPPSLFPTSCHPILSTSLCTPHLTATRPFVSSSYPSGSRSRLLTTLRGSETKVPKELILPLSMR